LDLAFRLTTFFLGFIYPAYKSFKAIERPGGADDTQWLTYWVVYAAVLIGELLAEYAPFWVPGYRAMKCGFVFWLGSSRFRGAQILYERALAPTVRAVEPVIDAVTSGLVKGDFSAVRKELSPAAEALQSAFQKTMTAAAREAKKAKDTGDAKRG